MKNYTLYALIVLTLAAAAISFLIWQVCQKFNELALPEPELQKTKLQYSFYVVTFIAAVTSVLLTVVKRREFFSMFAPIFIGLPSALYLTHLFTSFKAPTRVIQFTLAFGVVL